MRQYEQLLERHKWTPEQVVQDALSDNDMTENERRSWEVYEYYLKHGKNPNVNYKLLAKVKALYENIKNIKGDKSEYLGEHSPYPRRFWQYISSEAVITPLTDRHLNGMADFLTEYSNEQ